MRFSNFLVPLQVTRNSQAFSYVSLQRSPSFAAVAEKGFVRGAFHPFGLVRLFACLLPPPPSDASKLRRSGIFPIFLLNSPMGPDSLNLCLFCRAFRHARDPVPCKWELSSVLPACPGWSYVGVFPTPCRFSNPIPFFPIDGLTSLVLPLPGPKASPFDPLAQFLNLKSSAPPPGVNANA